MDKKINSVDDLSHVQGFSSRLFWAMRTGPRVEEIREKMIEAVSEAVGGYLAQLWERMSAMLVQFKKISWNLPPRKNGF